MPPMTVPRRMGSRRRFDLTGVGGRFLCARCVSLIDAADLCDATLCLLAPAAKPPGHVARNMTALRVAANKARTRPYVQLTFTAQKGKGFLGSE